MELSWANSVKGVVGPNSISSKTILLTLAFWLVVFLAACSPSMPLGRPAASNSQTNSETVAALNNVPVIHVFVALCDNVNQGIVPVSASLGNGDNPATNLYWGAAYGVKTFFSKSKDWEMVSQSQHLSAAVLERVIFKHRHRELYMIADAYQGKEIRKTTFDFLNSAAGRSGETITVGSLGRDVELHTHGSADLVTYIGHNGLMDFALPTSPTALDERQRKAIILACASKQYFDKPLLQTGATPLLWTTHLMAPEAYVLSAAIEGWANKESDEAVRVRAAKAYHKYQNCGLRAANRLFATGW